MSESADDFLAGEAAEARQAVQATLDELKASLGTATDVRLWAKQHPWAAVGVAAAAGFAAAAAVTPRPNQRFDEKMAGFADLLKKRNGDMHEREVDRAATRATFYQPLIFSLFELAKLAVGNLVTNFVQSRMNTGSVPKPEDRAADEMAAAATADSTQPGAF